MATFALAAFLTSLNEDEELFPFGLREDESDDEGCVGVAGVLCGSNSFADPSFCEASTSPVEM